MIGRQRDASGVFSDAERVTLTGEKRAAKISAAGINVTTPTTNPSTSTPNAR